MNTLHAKAALLAGCSALLLTLSSCGWGGAPAEEQTAGVAGDRGGIAGDNGDIAAPPAALAPSPTPILDIDELTGVQTQVMLDPGFLRALTVLGVEVGVVGTASVDQGTATFPITGGQLRYDDPASAVSPPAQGEIEHQGSGLRLSAAGRSVQLTDLVVDPDDNLVRGTIAVGDKVLAQQAPLLALTGGTLGPLDRTGPAGTATLTGTTLTLSMTAAEMLNDAFGITALDSFTKIGTAQVTVALPPS